MAAEGSPDRYGPPAAERVVIEQIEFEVVGASRRAPLLVASGLREGDSFDDTEELESALLRARQDLLNRRVFDSVDVSWRVMLPGGSAADGRGARPVPVAVTFTIVDGWTLLPIAFYRYNSNTGHNPFVVVYWDNILGTLTDFGMSAGYYSRDWVTPFRWDVRLDWSNVRAFGRDWNFSFDQVFNTTERATPQGDVELSYSRLSSGLGVSTSFNLADWVRYSISPGFSLTYGFQEITNETGESIPSNSASLSFSHGLNTGRLDWINNLRNGWSASLSNGVSYDARNGEFGARLSVTGELHRLLGNRVSPAVRAKVSHNLFEDSLSRGGVVRGVADNRVFGQTLASVNSQVSILAIDWRGVTDIQTVPFVDVGLARKAGEPVTSDDLFVGFGTDVVLFPDFVRGFEARMSVGFDAREVFVDGAGGPGIEFYLTNSLQF